MASSIGGARSREDLEERRSDQRIARAGFRAVAASATARDVFASSSSPFLLGRDECFRAFRC